MLIFFGRAALPLSVGAFAFAGQVPARVYFRRELILQG